MSKFARLSPKTRQGEELPKRVSNLPRGVYLAVQSTLENVWFGNPAPLDQACEHVQREFDEDADKHTVRVALAEFVNLLVRKLFLDDLPESVQTIQKIEWATKETLYRDIIDKYPQALQELKQRADALEKTLFSLRMEVLDKDRQVDKFRERKKQHDKTFVNYQQRIKELEEAEKNLQTDMERIAGLSPMEIKKIIPISQALSQSAQDLTGTS